MALVHMPLFSHAALRQCLPQHIMPGQSGSGSMPVLTTGPTSDSQGVVQMAINDKRDLAIALKRAKMRKDWTADFDNV